MLELLDEAHGAHMVERGKVELCHDEGAGAELLQVGRGLLGRAVRRDLA